MIQITGVFTSITGLHGRIEKWNGYATELGEEYIVTPKMFSGTKTVDGNGNVLLTGIAQGKDCLTVADGTKRTGIFALVDNKIVFELDPINKKYKFKGRVEVEDGSISIANGKIILNEDGSGHLANKSIIWDTDGKAYGDLFDKQYAMNTNYVELPTVPKGSIKQIILPYFVVRAILTYEIKFANQSDFIVYKEGTNTRVVTGDTQISFGNLGHGIIRLTGICFDTDSSNTRWVAEDINFSLNY